MIRKKCNYNPVYVFFLVIIMVFGLQTNWGIGESSQNEFVTFTNISDEPGKIKISVKKIMNYHHYENKKPTNEIAKGADGFHFQLWSGEYNEETGKYDYTQKHITKSDGVVTDIIIPFADEDLDKLKGVVDQRKSSEGEYTVFFNPELLGFTGVGDSESKHFRIEEVNYDTHGNVTPDERKIYLDINREGNEYYYYYYYLNTIEDTDISSRMYPAVFNNSYTPDSVSITIPVVKRISGRKWVSEDNFKFTITGIAGAPLRISTTDGEKDYTNQSFEFEFKKDHDKDYDRESLELNYTLDDLIEIKDGKQYYVGSKDFKYVIAEEESALPLTKAANKEITIRIKNDRSKGELTAHYVSDNNKGYNPAVDQTFYNEYDPQPIPVTLTVKKELLDDLPWPKEGFTFDLYQQKGEQKEYITSKQVKSSTSPYAEFDLELEKGEYTYIIKEVEGTNSNIFYNPHDHMVDVVVRPDDDTGSLTAEVTYIDAINNKLIIRNESKQAAVVILQAKKESNVPSARKFSFILQETDEEGKETAAIPKDTTTNDENGLVPFSLNLSAGTHYYKMSEYEPNPKLPGWTYDKNSYLFMIEVNQQGGTTTTTVKRKVGETWEIYDNNNPVVFTNTYTVVPENVTAEIQIEKRLTGRAWLEQDSFVFSLKSVDGSQIRTQDGTLVSSLETAAHMNNKEPKFPPIYYKLEDLNGEHSREFTYIVEETGYGKGITPDSSKEYTVTVENDVTEGKLRVKYGKHSTNHMAPSELEFKNHYEINDVKKAQIGVYKRIENRAWKSGDVFSFQIEAIGTTVDGMAHKDIPMPASSTLQITGNNESVPGQANTKAGYFGEITYTIPGYYSYIIEEIIPEQVEEGMEYDLREYLVEVKIEDNGDGTLKEPTVIYYSSDSEGRSVVNSPVFLNTYNKETHSYLFSFTKQWYGVPTDNVSFTLYNPDGTERKHVPVIKKESDKLWIIKYWLSSPGDYYAVENASNGYTPVYQNRGTHEEVQDRVYNGGKIINYQAPPTGDKNYLNAFFIIAGICLTGILIYAERKQNEK